MPRTLFDDQEPDSSAPRQEEGNASSAPSPLAERMRPQTLAERRRLITAKMPQLM